MAAAKVHFLRIADFIIRLENCSDLPLVIEGGYEPFLTTDTTGDADVTVRVHSGISAKFLEPTTPIYEAIQDGSRLWGIYCWEDGFRFMVYDPNDLARLQQVALLSADKRQWDIYSEPLAENGNRGLCPLLYPMGPLVMYYLTVVNEAIMIHASGIHDGTKGRIFSGFSGVGKSTTAGIWDAAGSTVINDDRLMIRKTDSGYVLHNTPMFYAAEPKQAKLDTIYLPYHSPVNVAERLSGSQAVSQLMAYCIQHGYDRSYIEHHLSFVIGMVQTVPVSTLGFVPNAEVIPFVRAFEKEHE